MGPPVAAANATAVSIAPDGAPDTAVTSQQQSRRRSSSGRQQLPPLSRCTATPDANDRQ